MNQSHIGCVELSMELDLHSNVKVAPSYPLDLERGLSHSHHWLGVCWMQLIGNLLDIPTHLLHPIENRKLHCPLICLAFTILLWNHAMGVAVSESEKFAGIVVT